MAKRYIVATSHTASYADPIEIKAGESVILTGKEDRWDGFLWLWAVGIDDREGWIPDGLIQKSGDTITARMNYSARELTCFEGDVLTSSHELNGWAWCSNQRQEQGWVPLRNLSTRAENSNSHAQQ